MAVPTLISQLSTVIASNVPAGSESPATLDEYQRAHAAFIAQLYSGPAFRATKAAFQSLSNGTAKLTFDTETFDTAACFDSATNYRFTPNVAGYYAINAIFNFSTAAGGTYTAHIYKNGSVYSSVVVVQSGTQSEFAAVSDIVSMNGSTDYVEMYYTMSSGGAASTLIAGTIFSGHLARLA